MRAAEDPDQHEHARRKAGQSQCAAPVAALAADIVARQQCGRHQQQAGQHQNCNCDGLDTRGEHKALHSFRTSPWPDDLEVDGLAAPRGGSTRTGFGGPLDKTPVQAARASQMPSGVHCGVAAEKRDMSRPAASNKRFQSGGGRVPDSLSTCGGTASNSSRRPCGSSITETMPETMGGGSPGSTVPNGNASGTSGRGLWRYQNRIAGGCMLPNRCSQRPGDLSMRSTYCK